MGIAIFGERPAPYAWLVETDAMVGLLALGVLAMQLVPDRRGCRHEIAASGLTQDAEMGLASNEA